MKKLKITVSDLVRRFLTSQRSEIAASSYKWYATYLEPFSKRFGPLPAEKINAALVRKWVTTYPDASQHNAARTVVRACNWGVSEHIFIASPLRGFRKPAPTRRDATLTPKEYALCVKHANPRMKDAVKFLFHTGCRPQELRAIEARWVTGNKIVFPLAYSKGGRKTRVILLDSMATAIVQRLAKANRTGPIFRNSHGHCWTKNSIGLAFQRLRKLTGIKTLCAYSFRHAYITRLLERGVDVATVAAIVGNSPAMVLEVYNHVDRNESRLQRIVNGGSADPIA